MTWCRFQRLPSLQLVADATDTSVDHIRSLNPELKRDITPRGDTYNVRIPAGRAKQFASLIQRIPPERRESARVISVAPGEDWQSVANRTGISAAQLQAMNSGVDLKSTTKLVAPSGGVKLTKWVRASTLRQHPRRRCRRYRQGSRSQGRHDRENRSGA